jgi:PAS domain S-box-containing protein
VATTRTFDQLLPAATAETGTYREIAKIFFAREPSWEGFLQALRDNHRLTAETERPGIGRVVLQMHGDIQLLEGEQYVCLVFTDVTSGKELEETVGGYVTRFRQIVQELPVMVYALDADKRIVVWNEQCEKITGYPSGIIFNNPEALALVYPQPDQLAQILGDLAASPGYSEYHDEPLSHHFGEGQKTISWIYRLNRTPIQNIHIWAIGLDITKTQQAVSALRFSEERFRTISHATNDAL